MGGIGSGRSYRYDSRPKIDGFRRLDVRRWARDGVLSPGSSFGWQWTRDGERVADIQVQVSVDAVTLDYKTRSPGEDWEPMRYDVGLLRTPCHLGGERVWFACPARGCGRRVAILHGGKVFACRHCHALAYPSQSELPFQRYQRRAQTIAKRLGWDTVDDRYWRGRPKGMHHRTYVRLLEELDAFEAASDAAFLTHFAEVYSSLG